MIRVRYMTDSTHDTVAHFDTEEQFELWKKQGCNEREILTVDRPHDGFHVIWTDGYYETDAGHFKTWDEAAAKAGTEGFIEQYIDGKLCGIFDANGFIIELV